MIEITEDPIRTDPMIQELSSSEDGAHVLFQGVVRNHAEGRTVRYLEYEAYVPMALARLREIRDRALQRFSVNAVGVIHRIGRLEIGEASVAVLVTSAHRAPALDACRFVMDELKKEVPIFKREYYEDGDCWIEGETSPDRHEKN